MMTGTTHKKRYKVQRLTYKSPPPSRVLSLPTSGRAALKADGPCATPPIVQNAAEKVKPSFWQSRPDKENNMLKEGIQHPLSDLSANLSFLHDRSPPLEEKKKTEIPIYKYSPFSPVDSELCHLNGPRKRDNKHWPACWDCPSSSIETPHP